MIKYGSYLNVKDCEWKGKVLLTDASATASHIGQHVQEGHCPHNRREAKNVAKWQNFSLKP